MRNVVFMRVT